MHASLRIKAEPKVKFHLWLLIKNRNWTADRLATRGWPHNDKCMFCDQVLESAAHLTLTCPFAREVWFSFQQSDPEAALVGSTAMTIKGWWRRIWNLHNNPTSCTQITSAAYVAWNLWKERNRRTFEGKRCSPETVAAMARDDIVLFKEATA